MSRWELTSSGALAMAIAGIITELLIVSSWASLFPRALGGIDLPDDWHRKLVEFERDRVLSMARGIGAAAAGLLAALVTSLVKNEIVVRARHRTTCSGRDGGGALLDRTDRLAQGSYAR